MARIENTNLSKVERHHMWGLSLSGWNNVMLGCLAFVAIAAASVLWAQYVITQLAKQEAADSQAALEKYKLTVEAKVAEARSEGIKAGEAASNAQLRAAELEKEAAQIKADNLETEKIIQPREFPIYGRNGDGDEPNKELAKFTSIKVWIQTVPDFEANRLAVSLNGLFRAIGWNVSTVGQAETGVGPLGIMEGVTILLRCPYDKFPPPPGAARDRLWDAAQLLVKRLQMDSALGSNFFSVHWEFLTFPSPNGAIVASPPPRAKVPDDTLLILIGMKPISALLSEKKAKAIPAQQHTDK